MDLSPLHNALDSLEQAVAGVAEKVSTAVGDTTSQAEVDRLVSRVEGLGERLAGINAPATETATSSAAAPPPPPATAAPDVPASPDAPAWTPEKTVG